MSVGTWIGIHGTGSCYSWLNGTCVPDSSPLWMYRDGDYSSSWAVNLWEQSGPPLDADASSDLKPFVCERGK